MLDDSAILAGWEARLLDDYLDRLDEDYGDGDPDGELADDDDYPGADLAAYTRRADREAFRQS